MSITKPQLHATTPDPGISVHSELRHEPLDHAEEAQIGVVAFIHQFLEVGSS